MTIYDPSLDREFESLIGDKIREYWEEEERHVRNKEAILLEIKIREVARADYRLKTSMRIVEDSNE